MKTTETNAGELRNSFKPISLPVILLAIFCTDQSLFAIQEGNTQKGPTADKAAENATTSATIDGTEPGWRAMTRDDFQKVNCDDNTFTWRDDGVIEITGTPVGVTRSVEAFTNFELILEWQHQKKAGNAGVFVWSPLKSLDSLKRGGLPQGIECQILDHGYTEEYEKGGNKADWFTTDGDVFPCAGSKMKPFAPVAPDGVRSFPREKHSRGFGEWNHYYIRAINGEIRLWVNGHEVSGGNQCEPATGHIALESEGSPLLIRNLKIRVVK